MLLLPEKQLPACSKAIRTEAAGTSLDSEIDDVIAAILVSRFNGRTITEICAMGGITFDDFTSSVAYRENFGLGLQEGQQKGRQEGRQEGRQAEAAALTLRLLQRRCGSLQPDHQALIQGLPLSDLENLADALLDFQGPEDLKAWLNRHAS
jgi:predicted transposase YdaD